MRAPRIRIARGLTLVELMIVVAVVAVIAMLAAPSFQDFIVTQRLRGVHAEFVTDLQYARSEAVSRGQTVSIQLGVPKAQCYILYAHPDPNVTYACDCSLPPGSRCGLGAVDLRTVALPPRVALSLPGHHPPMTRYNAINGSLMTVASNAAQGDEWWVTLSVDARRALQVRVNPAGRVSTCTPADSGMGGTRCL